VLWKGGNRVPITKAKKDEIVAGYVEILKNASGFVIISYAGLSTPQINELRAKIREANGQYVVAKNTLLIKALEQCNWPVPTDLLAGPSAIAFGMDNMPTIAKLVLEYVGADAPRGEKITLKGGILGESVFQSNQLDDISKLPTLDELRAQLAGLIIAPAQGIANAIHAATGQLINVIQALEDKNQEGNAA
jgi:large subunit ribosomal protein L10